MDRYNAVSRSLALKGSKKKASLLKRLICCLFDHDYYVVRRFSNTNRKVGCKRCNRRWGMNDSIRVLIPWDIELEEMYRSFRRG